MDILIKNAKLRDKQYLVNIGIKNGIIKKIVPANSDLNPEIEDQSDTVIDARGNLTTPTFIDPHLHLDKALISEEVPINKSGTLSEAIQIIWEKKKNYTTEEVVDRASRVIEMGIINGVTKFRTHVDIDTIVKLKGLEALLAVRKKYTDSILLQIVAFPQEGIFKNPGTNKLMKKAMKKGADVVGGMPYNELTYDDTKKHIDFCFKLAKDFNTHIDMHVDETDDQTARSLEYLAAKTIREKYHGKVTAGHTCALSAYNDSYAAKIISTLKEARINMITNPATNLMLQGRMDKQPIRRGITRVKELLEAGINVAYGQDCLKDTFYPTWGREDLLEVGMITAHAAQFTQPREIEVLFDMPTYNSAKILNIPNYGIHEDNSADLNIINAKNVQEAFRNMSDRLFVISAGRLVATTKTTKTLNLL
ncbi:amidohydrolase family protein [Elusimicrobiota bacterium]